MANHRSRSTILVVDDDEVKRYTLEHILRKGGFEVLQAATGAEAFRLVAARPDLIVLDVHLPDIDGYEVCRRLKADPATASTPILHVSTTFVDSEDKILGLDSGADGYLTDVAEPLELIATVRALLRARQAEDVAKLAAQQWQATFDAISDGICLVGRDGEIARCNRSLEAILAKSRGELLGHLAFDQAPDNPIRAGGELLSRMLASGRRESADLAAGDRWVHLTVDPIGGEAGAITGAVCILSDITESRRSERALRESEEYFRLLVEGVEDYAIFMTDRAGQLVSWNSGAERTLGYSEAEIVGQDFARIFTPEDRAEGKPAQELRTAEREGRAEDERWHIRKDGSRFWASGVVSPLRDEAGALRGFAKVMRDATEPKRLQEELRRRAEKLVEADRQKDQFLAMLAHELRNPLAPVRNALETIRLDADPTAIRRACELAGRQVGHMARLIDDLLDVSRITSGKIRLKSETVDLTRVLNDAIEGCRPLIEAGRHRLGVSLPPGPVFVEGDPTRLEQVFANLLNNAAKYTEPGGTIDVSAEPEGGEVLVRVRDNGIGLGEEMLSQVFDLFAQADQSLARAQGGLGIGLTLVRSLVQMHGGGVEARSDGPGLGSEFLVRLPVSESGASREVAPPSPQLNETAARALQILVVDDNVDSAVSLARVLSLWGHEARVVHDGPSAIVAATSGPTDLVLLDIGLPGMDGYQVAERLRDREGPAPLTLVALTGYSQEEDRRRSRDVGFDRHLVKPVDLDDLRDLLARHEDRATQT